MGVKEDIKIIRKALKKLCPTFSIRIARGTAYGWIDIWGSGDCNEFTEEEKQALRNFGLNYGGNCSVINPEERKYWVKKAEQILRGSPVDKIWKQMNESERYGCRFCLYPHWIRQQYPGITKEDLIQLSRLSEKQFGEL